jgi:hypothetical protein
MTVVTIILPQISETAMHLPENNAHIYHCSSKVNMSNEANQAYKFET